MLRVPFDLIFGCAHRRLSWPLTVRTPKKRTYVVCLNLPSYCNEKHRKNTA